MTNVLRIVKTLGDKGFIYEVRYCESSGIERLVASHQDEQAACKSMVILQEVHPEALPCAMALESLWPLAQLISRSSDEQGNSDYATKSHMRAWARRMILIIEDAMSSVWYDSSFGKSKGCSDSKE